jgi:hypothetical protein
MEKLSDDLDEATLKSIRESQKQIKANFLKYSHQLNGLVINILRPLQILFDKTLNDTKNIKNSNLEVEQKLDELDLDILLKKPFTYRLEDIQSEFDMVISKVKNYEKKVDKILSLKIHLDKIATDIVELIREIPIPNRYENLGQFENNDEESDEEDREEKQIISNNISIPKNDFLKKRPRESEDEKANLEYSIQDKKYLDLKKNHSMHTFKWTKNLSKNFYKKIIDKREIKPSKNNPPFVYEKNFKNFKIIFEVVDSTDSDKIIKFLQNSLRGNFICFKTETTLTYGLYIKKGMNFGELLTTLNSLEEYSIVKLLVEVYYNYCDIFGEIFEESLMMDLEYQTNELSKNTDDLINDFIESNKLRNNENNEP